MARITKGVWICVLVLCSSSFAENLHYNASSTDLDDKSLYSDSTFQDRSVQSDVDNDVLDSLSDGYGNFEDYEVPDKDGEFEEAFEKYKRNLYDTEKKYGQTGELGQQYSLRPGGIKFDPNKGIDPEEYVKKWKGKLLRQSFGHGLGTAKPGTMVGPFSRREKKKIEDIHNTYRANYTFPSANTEYLIYSEDLAIYAESVVLQCIYEDIVIPNSNYTAPFGKNVFIGSDPDPSYFLWSWYSEYEEFDFIKWECRAKECGHVTQILWATTSKVGCARQYCWPGEKVDTLILCLYYPPGNLINEIERTPVRGYMIGKPCSKCLSGNGYCLKSKCISKEYCDANNITYTCDLECQNCGVKNEQNCTCTCAEGWDYADCSLACANQYSYCDNLSDSYCISLTVDGMTYCREKCGLCNPVSTTDNTSMRCCAGIVCLPGEVLDVRECKCTPQCPSIRCYEVNTVGMELTPSSSPSVFSLFAAGMNYAVGLMFLIAGAFSG